MSRTALGVGVLRAMHPLLDRAPRVIDDDVSVRLFGDAARAVAADPASPLCGPRGDALRGHVLVRSAFAEQRLRAAIARGVRQHVALGAGYDTFAYRQPEWARGLRLFEVDAPSTQADKRERLAAAGVEVPRNLAYAPVDFESTSLEDGLSAAGFAAGEPAFFSWLGVMMYLSEEAVDAVLRFVAARPPESEIAFSFSAPSDGDSALERRVAEAGEPLRMRIGAGSLGDKLRRAGFRIVDIPTAARTRELLGERDDDLCVPDRAMIGAAVV